MRRVIFNPESENFAGKIYLVVAGFFEVYILDRALVPGQRNEIPVESKLCKRQFDCLPRICMQC